MIDQVPTLLGRSAVARALDEDLTAAARSDAKVLVTGESGVGKEVAARLIHDRSLRRGQPLVALNCAGVPDSLLESELFGHVRGSFTGAYRDKPGILEAASGGTVFLDEIGEMSLRMQALLLRFLESGELQRVGADRPTARVNVRVVCATNRDLAVRIAAGEFREDLFYRLNVVRIHVPPLRERPDDVPEFIDHFLRHFATRHRLPTPELSADTRQRLLSYRWPGNIRELKNVIERIVVRARQGPVTLADLPPELMAGPAHGSVVSCPKAPAEALADEVAGELYVRLTSGKASFWSLVYEPLLARDLTRDTVRRLVRMGLERTAGHYTALADLFGLDKSDYKRFLSFLRKHDCLVAHQPARNGRQDKGAGGPSGAAQVA